MIIKVMTVKKEQLLYKIVVRHKTDLITPISFIFLKI